jgi:hypothetical protein
MFKRNKNEPFKVYSTTKSFTEAGDHQKLSAFQESARLLREAEQSLELATQVHAHAVDVYVVAKREIKKVVA